jgi:F-type H+-transporting ATPase subunit epsilon
MPIELIIVTPQGEAFRGPVESVVLPGSEGDFGVLENHERFLCPLRIGEVKIVTGGDGVWAAIASGFADVNGKQVTVLVESCEIGADIDVARAELERDRAQEGLQRLDADEDRERFEQYERALRLAEARVSAGRHAQT